MEEKVCRVDFLGLHNRRVGDDGLIIVVEEGWRAGETHGLGRSRAGHLQLGGHRHIAHVGDINAGQSSGRLGHVDERRELLQLGHQRVVLFHEVHVGLLGLSHLVV